MKKALSNLCDQTIFFTKNPKLETLEIVVNFIVLPVFAVLAISLKINLPNVLNFYLYFKLVTLVLFLISLKTQNKSKNNYFDITTISVMLHMLEITLFVLLRKILGK